MPDRSFAGGLKTWTDLIAACRQNPELLAYAAPELRALEQTLGDLQAAKSRQVLLDAEKQKATAQHLALHQKASDLAFQIRSGVKAFLGPRNERLAEFNIKPLRGRRQR